MARDHNAPRPTLTLQRSLEKAAASSEATLSDDTSFDIPRPCYNSTFLKSGGTNYAPTVGAALMADPAHTDQTALQVAMLRERAFSEKNTLLRHLMAPSGGLKPAAGASVRVKSAQYENKWGSLLKPDGSLPNGHVPRTMEQSTLAAYHASARNEVAQAPVYALGQQSSVVFSNPPDGSPFTKQSYSKHLSGEPQNLANPGVVALLSDRAPESVVERRRRRNLHRLLMGEDTLREQLNKASAQTTKKDVCSSAAVQFARASPPPRRIPFNRKMKADSCAEFAQERLVMNNLVGETHQPGDPQELFPPYAKCMHRPEDNRRVTFSSPLEPPPSKGRERKPMGGNDCDFSLVRPRTTGFSPGHVRTIRYGRLGGPPRAHMAATGRSSGRNKRRAEDKKELLQQRKKEDGTRPAYRAAAVAAVGGRHNAKVDGKAERPQSSTRRRDAYAKELYAAIEAARVRAWASGEERVKKAERTQLATEVRALEAFDLRRDQRELDNKTGKRSLPSKSAYVRKCSAMTAATVRTVGAMTAATLSRPLK